MSVSEEDVVRIAGLARLQLSEEERQTFRRQLDQVLAYIQKLNELDTTDAEPASTSQHPGTRMREDSVEASLSREEALANARAQVRGFIRIPRVITRP